MASPELVRQILDRVSELKDNNCYCYFKPIAKSLGTEVEVDGRSFIMAGSNDYLGLTHDPRVIEAAIGAVHRYGTGHGGTRFLQGNTTMLEELEARLAAFVGKKGALVHSTGFLTNLGAIGSLVRPTDVILCDRENHASIFEGCRATRARVVPFAHNDAEAAAKKLEFVRTKYPDARPFLITEGVFSMSGDVTILPELLALKKDFPEMTLYLDDAHGLGVMGDHGRGTANHFGVVGEVDFIMGTFSKALGSIGGFIATDDLDALEHIRTHSTPLRFSTSLPPSNVATVLACLDILENEPEHVKRLWTISNRMRKGFNDLGLSTGGGNSPIIPVFIGNERVAALFSGELFKRGVFAIAAAHPAVPRGKAVIRTAFMSTHQEHQLEQVLKIFKEVAEEFHLLNGQDAQAVSASQTA